MGVGCLDGDPVWTPTCLCLGSLALPFQFRPRAAVSCSLLGRGLARLSLFEMLLLHCLFLYGPQGLKEEVRQLGLD